MKNEQKNQIFPIVKTDLSEVDQLEFLQTFCEMLFRACSTIKDTEYELQHQIIQTGATIYYSMEERFANK